ncbi:MFS transporter [Alkalihalophilus marmarensis]|uniref:MFS transporter n=1 Tax=Alkalihalophilus marmarensis TaxID=521377 RepID=UPI002E215A3A|nr:MFS transporter [Alkalihalophilus marmarensis]
MTKNKGIHYSWIVLLVTFIALLFVQGIRLSFGAFIEPWEESFEASRAQITSVSLVSYLVFAVLQPFIGRLIDRIGVKRVVIWSIVVVGAAMILTAFATKPWQIVLLYGVMASIGFGGMSNVVGTLVVAKWFTVKKGFAMGIMSAGTATGQFSVVPLSILMIEAIGWKLTVMILGMIVLIVLLPIILLLFKASPKEKGIEPYGGALPETVPVSPEGNSLTSKPKGSFFLQRPFLFLFFSFFICGFTTVGLIDTHLVPFAQYCGFTAATAGAAVSTLALFNFSGTIVSGYLSDKWDSRWMLGGLYGLRGLTIIILLVIVHEQRFFTFFLGQTELLFIFAISFGIVDFATVAPTMKLASEYAGKTIIGLMIGLLFFGHQIGAALGSFIPGVLFDQTGSYDITFVTAIILCLAASIMCFMLPRPKQV